MMLAMAGLRRVGILPILFLLVAGCSEKSPSTAPDDDITAGYVETQRSTILAGTNSARQSAGADPLVSDPSLDAVAQAHAQDMLVRGFFSHTNPDGESPFDRLTEAGISYSYAGENIAWYPSAEGAVQGWINSPGHYANMTYASYARIGIGVYRSDSASFGNYYYVQLFTN